MNRIILPMARLDVLNAKVSASGIERRNDDPIALGQQFVRINRPAVPGDDPGPFRGKDDRSENGFRRRSFWQNDHFLAESQGLN